MKNLCFQHSYHGLKTQNSPKSIVMLNICITFLMVDRWGLIFLPWPPAFGDWWSLGVFLFYDLLYFFFIVFRWWCGERTSVIIFCSCVKKITLQSLSFYLVPELWTYTYYSKWTCTCSLYFCTFISSKADI